MIIRKIDSNGDWQFGKGLSNYARDDLATAVNIETRLKSWVNDCFFDLTAGVDWSNRLEFNELENLREEVKDVILKSVNVIKLNSVDVVYDSEERNVTISYNIDTIYSQSFVNQIELFQGAA